MPSSLIFLLVLMGAACNSSRLQSLRSVRPFLKAEELTLCSWADDIPSSVLEAFTAEYGIKVKYVAYDSMEEITQKIRAGEAYDVVILDNRFIPSLMREGLLARIDLANVLNHKNVSANFRNLVYDPEGRYTIPYQWGATGLIVRTDLVPRPVTRWADLWELNRAGKVGLWRGEPRETLGLALKSLGFSANSEKREELEAALARLLVLKPHALFLEDYDASSSAALLGSGKIVAAMGWSFDALEGQQINPAIEYVFPEEGAMLWGENFVIPATSLHQRSAELLIDFLMRPRINAEIVNCNFYATANEAAFPFIHPEILQNPWVFPPNELLKKAEIVSPLSPAGEKLHEEIWSQFIDSD